MLDVGEAGLIYVRCMGLRSDITCQLTGDDYNCVGVYWRNEQNVQSFTLIDVVTRSAISLPGIKTFIDLAFKPSPWIRKLAVWPFMRPQNAHLKTFILSVQKIESMPGNAWVEFIHSPRSVHSILPPLSPLVLDPVHVFPGIIVKSEADTTPPDVQAILDRNDAMTISSIKGEIAAGSICLISQDPIRAQCIWCKCFRELVDSLVEKGHIDADMTARLFRDRKIEQGSTLMVVPPSLVDDWRALMNSSEPLIIPWELLARTARFLGISTPSSPIPGSHGVMLVGEPGALESVPHGSTYIHVPLFHADLSALDSDQLSELAKHLDHPSAAADARTSDLRLRVHDEQLRRHGEQMPSEAV